MVGPFSSPCCISSRSLKKDLDLDGLNKHRSSLEGSDCVAHSSGAMIMWHIFVNFVSFFFF